MADQLALDRDISVAEGFRRIVAARLVHLLAHEPAALAGEMEGVHQMRVALRQLRAALVLFDPVLDPGPAERFEAELKRLGRVLGDARDWDVFCAETLPAAFPGPPGAWRSALDDAAGAMRVAAHQGLREELGRPALAVLAQGLAAWAEAGALSPGLPPGTALRRLAPGLLDRLAGKVRKRGRHLDRRTAEELHALRKALKKLRYGVEDMGPLFPRRAVKPYRAGLKHLQEVLGGLNDAAMAESLAGQLGRHGPPPLGEAAAALARWAAVRQGGAVLHLAEAWAAFATVRPFW